MAKRKRSEPEIEYAYLLDPKDERTQTGSETIANYRTRTITSGDMIELEAFPIHRYPRGLLRAAKSMATPERVEAINRRNTEKRITRLLNTNFTARDISLTMTFTNVPDEQGALKELQRAIRRLRTQYRREVKAGLHPEAEPFKYLYVIEFATRDGEPVRIHAHMVCNLSDRDGAEKCWRAGRANADRLQPDRYGLTALAKYLTKAPRKKRRWAASRSLREPKITQADKKLSKRQAERMIIDVDANARAICERIIKGAQFLDCTVKTSEYMQGAYIYARMYKPKRE